MISKFLLYLSILFIGLIPTQVQSGIINHVPQEIFVGASAPSNTGVLWMRSGNNPQLFTYHSGTAAWIAVEPFYVFAGYGGSVTADQNVRWGNGAAGTTIQWAFGTTDTRAPVFPFTTTITRISYAWESVSSLVGEIDVYAGATTTTLVATLASATSVDGSYTAAEDAELPIELPQGQGLGITYDWTSGTGNYLQVWVEVRERVEP